MANQRILIIANKNWEADAVMNVLLQSKACPDNFPWPITLNHPLPPNHDWKNPTPRAVFRFQDSGRNSRRPVSEARVEVWCIQDAMNPSISSSSTKEKVRVLPKIIMRKGFRKHPTENPDFVMALGTGAYPGETSYNGCVFTGSNVFIHDPYHDQKPPDSSHWSSAMTGKLFAPSEVSVFSQQAKVFDHTLRAEVETRFIVPPVNPSQKLIMAAAANYTAVGVANITNYDDYAWADDEALHKFNDMNVRRKEKFPIGSLETTHGIIRLQSGAPFMFVSGITDRIGCFNMEVGSRPYAQNFACAHNAGVVAAWLIPRIVKHLSVEGE